MPFHPHQYRNLILFCLEFDGGYGESINDDESFFVVEKTIRFFAVSFEMTRWSVPTIFYFRIFSNLLFYLAKASIDAASNEDYSSAFILVKSW